MAFGESGSGTSQRKISTSNPYGGKTPQNDSLIHEEEPLAPNPLFDKIRTTLQRTEPDKWRRSGEAFNPELKNPKPIDVWETVFILTMKEGNLVLRCSVPLKSEYFGGGYTLIPLGDSRYTVEIREKGWNPRELTDPFYAHSQKKHLKVQTLIEGRMAKILFNEVRGIVESFNTEKRRTFERECCELMTKLPTHVKSMTFDNWKREDGDSHIVRYHAMVCGMSVDIAQVTHDDRITFHLKFGRDGMYKSIASTQVEAIFEAIEDLGREANLTQLSNLLDSIDL